MIIADEMRMGRRPRNANETRTSPTKGGDVEALIARPLGRRGSLSHRSCVPTRDAAVEMRPAITENGLGGIRIGSPKPTLGATAHFSP